MQGYLRFKAGIVVLMGVFLGNIGGVAYAEGGNAVSPGYSLGNLNGKNGFLIKEVFTGNDVDVSFQPYLGDFAVSGTGDVNGDGFDDFLIGAWGANEGVGQSFLIFGSNKPWPAVIELLSLNRSTGIAISGIDLEGASGKSLSGGGDINGDGIADILIGAKNKCNVLFGCNVSNTECFVNPESKTPLILGLTLGLGGGGLLMGSMYYVYQRLYYNGYTQVQ